jgi:polysaccharide biosynthesis transport protein
VLGLGLGIAAAFLRETIGTRIRTRTELAHAAGVPVYAELPATRAARQPVPVDRLLTAPEMTAFHEALRELQTNLMFGDHRSDSILITSPEGRHGKSTVAVGLAVSIAQAGVHTILVDADLRRGTIAERLRLQQVRGLTEVLDGAPLATCIQHTPLRGLDVLPSGRLIAESGELIASHFPAMLERLSETYEMVVVDTTPLVPVNDARVLASFVKTTIIVAAAGKASKQSVEEAVERLAFLGIRPTGTVLNKSKRISVGSYYAYDVHRPPTSPRAEPEALPQKHSATSP